MEVVLVDDVCNVRVALVYCVLYFLVTLMILLSLSLSYLSFYSKSILIFSYHSINYVNSSLGKMSGKRDDHLQMLSHDYPHLCCSCVLAWCVSLIVN